MQVTYADSRSTVKSNINNIVFTRNLFDTIGKQRGGALSNSPSVDADGGDGWSVTGGKVEIAKTDYR